MRISHTFLAIAAASLLLSGSAIAAAPKTYQVTGPILEVTDTTIVVQNKDKERWEVSRDASTKVTGELKVGAKVTITYTMTAVTADVRADKPAKGDKPAKK